MGATLVTRHCGRLTSRLQEAPVLARIRISVPDRPGALGAVASAIGRCGADIVKVDVLQSESGRALDDVFVVVRDLEQLISVSQSLSGQPGVSVEGTQHPAPPTTGHADLELLAQVLARPERGGQTLVDGAPGALGADWGALVAYQDDGSPGDVLATSPYCPGSDHVRLTVPLRLASVRMWPPGGDEPYGGTALVPVVGMLGLVLVRTEGPPFHSSELWRLGQVGQIAATALLPATAI
jgi:hypothetical protein